LPCDQPPAVPDCSDGWCTIEPGCFFMGSPWCEWGRAGISENPIQITLTRRFRIQQFESTQGEWTAAGLPNPAGLTEEGIGDCVAGDCPLGNVTWWEAAAYANLRSRAEGLPECYALEGCAGELGEGMACERLQTTPASMYECEGYRLPTGAEWEYAARAGTRTSAYTGDVSRDRDIQCYDEPVLDPIAWYCANAGSTTHPVGLKEPNAWGLFDVLGNAREWDASIDGLNEGGPYVDWGAELPLVNGVVPDEGFELRGGGFNAWPSLLSTSRRGSATPSSRGHGVGFRLVQTLE